MYSPFYLRIICVCTFLHIIHGEYVIYCYKDISLLDKFCTSRDLLDCGGFHNNLLYKTRERKKRTNKKIAWKLRLFFVCCENFLITLNWLLNIVVHTWCLYVLIIRVFPDSFKPILLCFACNNTVRHSNNQLVKCSKKERKIRSCLYIWQFREKWLSFRIEKKILPSWKKINNKKM